MYRKAPLKIKYIKYMKSKLTAWHMSTGTCFIQKIYAPYGRGGGIYYLNETSACAHVGCY
jgi:hypothetical protein